jgi:hypothetical protein
MGGSFLSLLEAVLGREGWPKPFHILEGVSRVRKGEPVRSAAARVRTSASTLQRAVDADDPVRTVLGISTLEVSDSARTAAVRILGQMLLGRCAELAFEDIYRAGMATEEFQLRDVRESRSDTDYRVFNGQGRPIFRINIKFHGAQFRRARELVGLEPEDCFALATYKIHSAMGKQEEERLPYFFAIVGVPHLTAPSVGLQFPAAHVDAVALVHNTRAPVRKRDFEDAVITHEVKLNSEVFQDTYRQIRLAQWYVLSARKADSLLRQRLFQRVFALRVRGFARQFRGAELDMHFSLSGDLTPLEDFLTTLKSRGLSKIATQMERGEY